MGNRQSSKRLGGGLAPEDLARIQRRFDRLAGGTGQVAIPQFQNMVELGGNPFISRIFQVRDYVFPGGCRAL